MSDPNRIAVTRPTLSMDFSESAFDTPPAEVVFFDTVALTHTDVLQAQLAAWPPEVPPKKHEQPAFDVYRAITGVLEGSRSGRTIDYDNATWFGITNDPAYEIEAAKMQTLGREGEKANPQREQVAVRGLAIYVERLRDFMTGTSDENVA